MPDNIILYSTNCPKCKILKEKLNDKHITYTIHDSVQEMLDLGITNVPVLSIDGNLLDFSAAVRWVKQVS